MTAQPGDAKTPAAYPYAYIRSQHWDRATNIVDRRDETWWRAANGSGEAHVRRLPERRDLTRMPSRKEHLALTTAQLRIDRYPDAGVLAPMLTEPIPTDQATLTTRLAEHAPPENGPQATLRAVCDLASFHYLTQATRASTLRILATVKGLTYTGAAADIAGRTGWWFQLDTPGNRDTIAVDPRTGRLLLCSQTVATRPAALFSFALYLESDRVARPGQRPAPAGQHAAGPVGTTRSAT